MGWDDDGAWFAVDGAGRVAAFRFQKTGAVPRRALEDDVQISSLSLFKFLEAKGNRCHPILDLRGSFLPDQEAPPGRHTLRHDIVGATLGCYHVFVKSRGALGSWIQDGECRSVGSTEGAAAVFPELKKSIARVLHGSPALLGALPCDEIAYGFPDDVVASFGIYVYELLSNDSIAFPYGRIAFPSRPIDVTALPEKMVASPALARLERCDFGQATYLQPCEWTPCEWPGHEFLAADFSTVRSG